MSSWLSNHGSGNMEDFGIIEGPEKIFDSFNNPVGYLLTCG
jgi:hypothetical protein